VLSETGRSPVLDDFNSWYLTLMADCTNRHQCSIGDWTEFTASFLVCAIMFNIISTWTNWAIGHRWCCWLMRWAVRVVIWQLTIGCFKRTASDHIKHTTDCTTLVWNLKRRIEVKPTSSRVFKCWFEVGKFQIVRYDSLRSGLSWWFEISGAIQG